MATLNDLKRQLDVIDARRAEYKVIGGRSDTKAIRVTDEYLQSRKYFWENGVGVMRELLVIAETAQEYLNAEGGYEAIWITGDEHPKRWKCTKCGATTPLSTLVDGKGYDHHPDCALAALERLLAAMNANEQGLED